MSTKQTSKPTKRPREADAIADTRADGLRAVADHLPALGAILEDFGGYAGHLREARDCYLNGNVLGGLQSFEDAIEVLDGIQGAIAARKSELQRARAQAMERGVL